MMNCFPLLYEDELFYSIISRYKRMCGITSKRAFLEDLFNEEIINKSIFFPQYIDALVNNLPLTSKITAEELIMNNTMFPFFTVFLSEEKTDEVYKFMKNGASKSIESMVGFTGSKVKSNKFLRYCPICYREDMNELGESYWRRLYQVPGVLYCEKHEILLKDSQVLNTDSRIGYYCPDSSNCDFVESNIEYDDRIKKLNIEYIRNAKILLKQNYNRKESQFLINFYIDRLRDKGFTSKGGSIYMKELQREFLDYYSHDYLKLMQSDFDINREGNWVRLFVRNNNKIRSPLRHLLFIQFLDIDINEMFESKRAIGRIKITQKREPIFDLNTKREEWLKLIENNPGANRSELKEIGKGLHTYVYTYDREWYDKVTPKGKPGRMGGETVDWEKRDEECLQLSKKAVPKILNRDGKPIRIGVESIRREIGVRNWFYDKRLIKTYEYIDSVVEDIDSYRIRKIRWAINEMLEGNEKITPYKVQLYAGFGGNNKEVRLLIEKELQNMGILKEIK